MQMISSDPSKKYFLISEHNTADKTKEGPEEQKIKGNSKAHVISFNADGKAFQKWETVKDFLDQKELELEEDEPDVNLKVINLKSRKQKTRLVWNQ